MVAKKSFLQNGRLTQQRRISYNKKFLQTPQTLNLSTSHMLMSNYNQMFSISQIPDNPGYVDFNLPTPQYNCTTNTSSTNNHNVNITKSANSANNRNINVNENVNNDSAMPIVNSNSTKNNPTASSSAESTQTASIPAKKKNAKTKQKGKQQLLQHKVGWRGINQQQQQQQQQQHHQTKYSNKFYTSGSVNLQSSRIGLSRQFKNRRGGGSGSISDRSVIPPMTMVRPPVVRGSLSRPFIHKSSSLAPRTFQPPNVFPPIPPPMIRQIPPSLRFIRRGNGPMLPIRPPLPPMRMTRNIASPLSAIPINAGGTPRIIKNFTKGKSTIKTLKNLINQYPMEKPWVTAEIRAEYDKKIDIEERLKGHKNDDLFAQFKVQRDKFVSMYETARDEYIKQEAAAVKAKSLLDAKDKQANATTINKNAIQKDSK